MNRRDFIAGAVAAAAAEGRADAGIVDTHTHFYDPGRAAGVPWPPKSDALLYRRVMPDDFVRVAGRLGVTGTIVVEASPWLEDNQWILDLALKHSVICGFVGHLEPGTSAFAANLARFARNPLFRGIRVGQDGLGAVDDLRRLAGAGLMLDVLGPASMFAAVARLAQKIPELRIVVDHLPFEEGTPGVRDLAQSPRVYAKVSGVLRRDAIEEVYEAFGPDRVLYASNWPVSERMGSYAERLGLLRDYFSSKPAGVADKFFSANSRSAYGRASTPDRR